MGMDLRILPQYSQNADFAHDTIECARDYDLFSIIEKVEKENGREIPRKGITTFVARGKDDESCYGKTFETPYGDVIKGVQNKKLKKALANYKPEHWRNKAVISFLNELPDDLEIWLYWH